MISKLESFGQRTLEIADAYWKRRIVDGTKAGNKIIGTEILPAAGLPAMPGYQNGSTAWCGVFAQACLLAAGARKKWLNVISAGKAVYGFGRGNRLPSGKKAFAKYPVPPWLDERDCFNEDDCWNAETDVIPGATLLVRISADSIYHGHVMLVVGNPVQVSSGQWWVDTIEGNATGRLPDGKQGEGVVRQRRLLTRDHWFVRLAEEDLE